MCFNRNKSKYYSFFLNVCLMENYPLHFFVCFLHVFFRIQVNQDWNQNPSGFLKMCLKNRLSSYWLSMNHLIGMWLQTMSLNFLNFSHHPYVHCKTWWCLQASVHLHLSWSVRSIEKISNYFFFIFKKTKSKVLPDYGSWKTERKNLILCVANNQRPVSLWIFHYPSSMINW